MACLIGFGRRKEHILCNNIIMAKQTILKERGSSAVMYPQTLASLVKTSDGGNVDEGLDKAKRAVFIDLWNNACIDPLTKRAVGRYNESTGYFELNGLTDITYQQAMNIYRYTSDGVRLDGEKIIVYGFAQFRTNLPPSSGAYWIQINNLFSLNRILEVARLPQYYSSGVKLKPNNRSAFEGCYKLREIINVMEAPSHVSDSYTWYGTFSGCFELETVWIKGLYGNISFAHSPLISSDSISYLVENRTTAHTDVITVTVHADTFAKLTGDTTNPAVAALTPAELAQWQQILAAATTKNISFTTS